MVSSVHMQATRAPVAFLTILLAALALSVPLIGCSSTPATRNEILIALKPEAILLLSQPQEPDPMHTGIASLDALNRRWNVRQMVPVFPDVSSDDEAAFRYGLAGIYKMVVPAGTDLEAMIRDYEANPYIDYAELNLPFEIK